MPISRLIKVVFHPFFIGLIFTVVLIIRVTQVIPEYKIQDIRQEYLMGNLFNYYNDLDKDGSSERILIDLNAKNLIKIQLFRGSQFISQFNLEGSGCGGDFLYTGDFNSDSLEEIFIFSCTDDSLFLNIINSHVPNAYYLKDRFIDCLSDGMEVSEGPVIDVIGLTDYDNNKISEIVFTVTTGFRKQPRNCYLFDISRDNLMKSPQSGASLYRPLLWDITGDKDPEIMAGSMAPGNLNDTFPFTDQYGWLMVFNRTMQFVFEPIKFEKHPCKISAIPVSAGDSTCIVILNHYFGSDTVPSLLALFDKRGQLLRKISLSPAGNNAHILQGESGTFYLLGNQESAIEVRDANLHLIRTIKSPSFYDHVPVAQIDADGDGMVEYLFKGRGSGLYYLVRKDFSSFSEIKLETDLDKWPAFVSLVVNGNRDPYFYLPLESGGNTYYYFQNPLYKLRYLIYLILYLAISGFLYLIYAMLQYRARMHYEATRRINELQLRSVKSRMDPHFTFNVLNSIGSLYSQIENRKKADYLFGKYARMLRDTLVTTDTIEVKLEHELQFVTDYLDIEKFRIGERFSYTLNLEPGVDKALKIPRMLIHTFVENAVKYAVRQIEGDAWIKIDIRKSEQGLHISVSDNGPGMHALKKHDVGGTGKGLLIVDEMVRLYYDLTRTKISYHLSEISENNECRGTRAEIVVA